MKKKKTTGDHFSFVFLKATDFRNILKGLNAEKDA